MDFPVSFDGRFNFKISPDPNGINTVFKSAAHKTADGNKRVLKPQKPVPSKLF